MNTVATKRFVWSESFIKNDIRCWICKKKKGIVHEHLKEETNLCVWNKLIMHQGHKQQYVEKYPHIFRNFLAHWFKD